MRRHFAALHRVVAVVRWSFALVQSADAPVRGRFALVHREIAAVQCVAALVHSGIALVRGRFAVVHREIAVLLPRFAPLQSGVAPVQRRIAPPQNRRAQGLRPVVLGTERRGAKPERAVPELRRSAVSAAL